MRTPCGIRWPSPDGENRAREQWQYILANFENIFMDGIFAKPIKIYLCCFYWQQLEKNLFFNMLSSDRDWKFPLQVNTFTEFWGVHEIYKYSLRFSDSPREKFSLINFRATSGRKQPSLQHKGGWREHAVLLKRSATKKVLQKDAAKRVQKNGLQSSASSNIHEWEIPAVKHDVSLNLTWKSVAVMIEICGAAIWQVQTSWLGCHGNPPLWRSP